MGAVAIVLRGIVFLIGVPFLLIGVGLLLIFGATLVGEYQASQGVASTEGTITSTSLEETTTTEDGVTESVYYPRVHYTYAVDGQNYEGNRVFPSHERSSSSELEGKEYEDITEAQRVLRQYGEGESVTVYYREGNPGEASLKRPSVDWGDFLVALIFAGIPLAIGVALSGSALFFGRIRARFRSDSDHAEAVETDDEDEGGWDDDGDGDGGGWGGGGWGGGDGGGGGGE